MCEIIFCVSDAVDCPYHLPHLVLVNPAISGFQNRGVYFFSPLFGVMAGGLLLDEAITPSLILALVLVGAGIYLVNRPQPAVVE